MVVLCVRSQPSNEGHTTGWTCYDTGQRSFDLFRKGYFFLLYSGLGIRREREKWRERERKGGREREKWRERERKGGRRVAKVSFCEISFLSLSLFFSFAFMFYLSSLVLALGLSLLCYCSRYLRIETNSLST
jgi:hypothetical protein